MITLKVRTKPVFDDIRRNRRVLLLFALAAYCYMMGLRALNAQTPITQNNPQFKPQVDYKTGTFTVRILYVEGQVECGQPLVRASKQVCVPVGPLLTITSSDKRITGAIVEIFYQTRLLETKSKEMLLLHRELICPILIHGYAGTACNQNLEIPIAAIKMIRIKGSTEVETAELGHP